MTEQSDAEPFGEWAIVELMGHRRLAGFVTEATLFGGKLMRVEIPADEENEPRSFKATQLYGASAVYCVTFVTEEVARTAARRIAPAAPVTPWELSPPSRPATVIDGGEPFGDDF